MNNRICYTFSAKRKKLYFHCGKLFAISLCNGGGVGRSLAPCMFDFIAYGENNYQPSIDDVQDYEIKTTLQKVGTTLFSLSQCSFASYYKTHQTVTSFPPHFLDIPV
jgi:hypothetical protein